MSAGAGEAPQQAHVKGSAFSARVAWVKEKHPEDWARFAAQLQKPTREIVEGSILKSAWYAYAEFLDFVTVADRVFGKGDLALVKEMAKYAAAVNLPTVYKVFYKLGSPDYILARAAQLYQVHYDSGAVTVVEKAPGRAKLEVSGFAMPNRVLCLTIEGFIEQTLTMTGVKNLSTRETQCMHTGGKVCTYDASWEE